MSDFPTLATLCPKSNKPVVDRGTYYRFEGFPTTYCNKQMAQRVMTADEYVVIFQGKCPQLEGFISTKSGAPKPFSAKVVYDETSKTFKFTFDNAGSGPAVPTGVKCPISKQPVMDMGTFFRFPGHPKVYFNKVVAKRPVTVEEYADALTAKEPVYLDGFVSSKTGNTFQAALVLDPDQGRMVFQFPPRGDGPPKSKGAAPKSKGKREDATSGPADTDRSSDSF